MGTLLFGVGLEQGAAPEAAEESATGFAIRKIYIKDLSFEAPGSPAIFSSRLPTITRSSWTTQRPSRASRRSRP